MSRPDPHLLEGTDFPMEWIADPNAWIGLATLIDLDAAIAGYTAVIRLKPDYPTAFYNRAIAYNAKGDTENATRDALEYERLKDKNPQ